ncbi:hypothetical protein HMPREF9443_00848 [Phascolarctobacterium succinatutens YIT 12067]|uniref:Uncharacterized protein n=1 Tax=Phascolarctobacterium succinatutens YIT 12067 TaxID=626939 RepID=E8LDC1_9FIRM|nr:hypothetical protein HMPREF9443_00848 [Phascolarctobacterium succinatutens YIT 12067]
MNKLRPLSEIAGRGFLSHVQFVWPSNFICLIIKIRDSFQAIAIICNRKICLHLSVPAQSMI